MKLCQWTKPKCELEARKNGRYCKAHHALSMKRYRKGKVLVSRNDILFRFNPETKKLERLFPDKKKSKSNLDFTPVPKHGKWIYGLDLAHGGSERTVKTKSKKPVLFLTSRETVKSKVPMPVPEHTFECVTKPNPDYVDAFGKAFRKKFNKQKGQSVKWD